MIDVAGNCPMGCGSTLFLGDGGYVTCSLIGCQRPTAASEILEERERDHLVEIGEETFSVKHPLRERLDDELLNCGLGNVLKSHAGPPFKPGTYRAVARLEPSRNSDGSPNTDKVSWCFVPVRS